MALLKCKDCGAQMSSDAKSCPSCGAKPPKRTSFIALAVAGIFLIGLIKTISGSSDPANPPPSLASASTPAPLPPPAPKPERPAALVKEIERLSAIPMVDFCSKELRKIRSIKGNWPQPWGDAVSEVMKVYGVDYEHEMSIRGGGVVVGMTKCGALAGWGRPQSVNTTTTRHGTREQWVYGGRNYLYFDGELLTTIQN